MGEEGGGGKVGESTGAADHDHAEFRLGCRKKKKEGEEEGKEGGEPRVVAALLNRPSLRERKGGGERKRKLVGVRCPENGSSQ